MFGCKHTVSMSKATCARILSGLGSHSAKQPLHSLAWPTVTTTLQGHVRPRAGDLEQLVRMLVAHDCAENALQAVQECV